LTLRLYQQADVSKRRPVCISGLFFRSVSRNSCLSNSSHRDFSPMAGATSAWADFSPSAQLYQPCQTLFDRWVKYSSRRWFIELSAAFFVFPRGFYKVKRLCPDLSWISGSPSRDSLSEDWAHVRESSRPRISCLSDLWLMCQRILLARSGRLSRDQPKNAVLPCKKSFCGTSSGQIAKISLRSGLFRFGRLNVPKHATGGYMSEMVSPAEQVNEEAKPFYA